MNEGARSAEAVERAAGAILPNRAFSAPRFGYKIFTISKQVCRMVYRLHLAGCEQRVPLFTRGDCGTDAEALLAASYRAPPSAATEVWQGDCLVCRIPPRQLLGGKPRLRPERADGVVRQLALGTNDDLYTSGLIDDAQQSLPDGGLSKGKTGD